MCNQFITDYNRNNPGNVWREYSYDLAKPSHIAKYIARTKYAFPGGYELYGFTDDGGVICHTCCRSEFANIVSSYKGDGWHLISITSTADDDMEPVYCDHCSRAIYDPE